MATSRFLVLSNPRAGSTFLCSLLKNHWKISMEDELLNDENLTGNCDPLASVEKKLSQLKGPVVGFKVFPEQLFFNGLRFDDLVRYVNATCVIVLWRENVVETLISRRIADKTDQWYNNKDPTEMQQVVLDIADVTSYSEMRRNEWRIVGTQWPVDVVPIFVKYEDLSANPLEEIEKVLAKMSLGLDECDYNIEMKRQNPAPLEQKVTNWKEISTCLKEIEINVPHIVTAGIEALLMVPKDKLHVVPDREPPVPPDGWRYRVSEPLINSESIENVMDAVYGRSVSSAGCWPQKLASKLKRVFGVPVVQPCCNGFTSIILALQAARIGQGDEVIMPSMTMVAVPNAVKFLNGKPIFIDNVPNNYNPGWCEIESAITRKTKAVILTHTFGVPSPDLELIVERCKQLKLVLIEDISECVGVKVRTSSGKFQKLGSFGDFACASLYANKIINAGDGGFVLAKDPKIYSRLKSLVNHGFTPSYHFLHFESAINAKINGLGAAMACGNISKLDDVLKHRSEIASIYRMRLKNTALVLSPECGVNDTPWVFGVECQSKQQRSELRAYMAKHGIETRNFFFPLHLQPAFAQEGITISLPNTEKLASCGYYLPTHPNLTKSDLSFICDVIENFFQQKRNDSLLPPCRLKNEVVRVVPGSLRLEAVTYHNNGEVEHRQQRGANLLEAIGLGIDADHLINSEKWDEREMILNDIKHCIKTSDQSNKALVSNHFQPYIDYLESQNKFEPMVTEPWLAIDLNNLPFSEANKIPTTTDFPTKQLLCWLIEKIKASTIVEIGCWFGHCTYLMAASALKASENSVVFACDSFKWQGWMHEYVGESQFDLNQSFKPLFDSNVQTLSNIVKSVHWPYDVCELPDTMKTITPDLIFIDFTQYANDLEKLWQIILPILKPNKTIIVFNGVCWKSIPFFTNHAHELMTLAQPHQTLAKAFIFKPFSPEPSLPDTVIPFPRKLNFQPAPDWNHHHQNAFSKAIDTLKSSLHSDKSSILFIPSVEVYLCDNPELLSSNPWVGIVHEVPQNLEQFYVPDLEHLCSEDYTTELKMCKGLFTLTQVQHDFLMKNWPEDVPKVPIHSLTYPIIPSNVQSKSKIMDYWVNGNIVELVSIGSFARDFDLFFNMVVPKNVQKVLLMGDDKAYSMANKAPGSVVLRDRLDEEEYEKLLQKSVVFLSQLYDGAANTIIVECISRNVPIVCPNFKSCQEYLGEDYPLLYDAKNVSTTDFTEIITMENVKLAVKYLMNLDKTKFSTDYFVENLKRSAILLNIPGVETESPFIELMPNHSFHKFDVTISICSYKRTHHLPVILKQLWEMQDFSGRFEIIVWNNNEARKGLVSKICHPYVASSTKLKSLHLINSTKNYFAQIRFALPPLMQSDCLLICDDDIIPGTNFLSFFLSGKEKYPNEVLCVRGHKFFPHQLDMLNASDVWQDYHNLKFVPDTAPTQFIHFAHADACLIPKKLLQECASVEMPDSEFALVDDYWMSFILSHKFGRKIRKLCINNESEFPLQRTDDSDVEGLALHTRPVVQDVRIRLYVYHMTQGWPQWPIVDPVSTATVDETLIAQHKQKFWDKPFIGINTSSNLSDQDITDLVKLGVQCVRIGAVGIGRSKNYDLCSLLTDPDQQLKKLSHIALLLEKANIAVVITLDRRLASPLVWRVIATQCHLISNVIGYDLINEPYTETEDGAHLVELETLDNDNISQVIGNYKQMIGAIREVDKITPIVIEPTFWGHIDALERLPIAAPCDLDPLLIVSFHFYQPRMLTKRDKNKGRFQFPGDVPIYDAKYSETVYWDEEKLMAQFEKAAQWGKERNLKIFLGEFGISRDTCGADKYLQSVTNVCRELGISAMLYSFRDKDWEAMNYELGPDVFNGRKKIPWSANQLMTTIMSIISDWKKVHA